MVFQDSEVERTPLQHGPWRLDFVKADGGERRLVVDDDLRRERLAEKAGVRSGADVVWLLAALEAWHGRPSASATWPSNSCLTKCGGGFRRRWLPFAAT
jgi:hypothetical protein